MKKTSIKVDGNSARQPGHSNVELLFWSGLMLMVVFLGLYLFSHAHKIICKNYPKDIIKKEQNRKVPKYVFFFFLIRSHICSLQSWFATDIKVRFCTNQFLGFWVSWSGEIALSDFLTVDTNCCHLLGNLRSHLTCLHRQATSGQQMKRKIGNPFSTNLEISLLKSFEIYKTNITILLNLTCSAIRYYQSFEVLKKKLVRFLLLPARWHNLKQT